MINTSCLRWCPCKLGRAVWAGASQGPEADAQVVLRGHQEVTHKSANWGSSGPLMDKTLALVQFSQLSTLLEHKVILKVAQMDTKAHKSSEKAKKRVFFFLNFTWKSNLPFFVQFVYNLTIICKTVKIDTNKYWKSI